MEVEFGLDGGGVGWVVVCKVIFVSNPTSVEVKLVWVDVVVGVVTIMITIDFSFLKSTFSSSKTEDFRGYLDKSLNLLRENLSKVGEKIFDTFIMSQRLLLTIKRK